VASLQVVTHVAHLDGVVAFVRGPAELHFLHLDDLLPRLRLVGALLFLVAELAVVHQATDRRRRGGCDLHQIHVFLFGEAAGLPEAHDAEWLVVHADQADFRGRDLAIEAMVAFCSDAELSEEMNRSADSRRTSCDSRMCRTP